MKRYLYFIIVIALWACDRNQSPNNENFAYRMDISQVVDSISFDSIVEGVEYIQLESHPKAVVGEISDLIVDNGNFYVVSDGVYCFNQAGKFKYALNQRGKERSEFIECRTVSVSEKFVYIYDGASMKILAFDKNNGKYIKSIKIEDSPYRIYVNGNDMILDYADFNGRDENSCRFSVKNFDTDAIKYNCMNAERHKALIEKQLSRSYTDVLFSDYYHCNTYKITADSCQAYFSLEIPQQSKYSQSELDEMIGTRVLSLKNEENDRKIIGLGNVHETNELIYGECKQSNQFVHILFNKRLGSGIAYNSVIVSPGQIAPISFYTSDARHFYSIMSASEIDLIKFVQGEDKLKRNLELSKRNLQTLLDCEPESNPIIIKYRLK